MLSGLDSSSRLYASNLYYYHGPQAAHFSAFAACALTQVIVADDDDVSPYFDAVSKHIDPMESELWNINKEIHGNPELVWEEEKTHELLTSFMEGQDGWRVDESIYNISTAFVAVFEWVVMGQLSRSMPNTFRCLSPVYPVCSDDV